MEIYLVIIKSESSLDTIEFDTDSNLLKDISSIKKEKSMNRIILIKN